MANEALLGRLRREPLVLFLCVAIVLFAVHSLAGAPRGDEDRRIIRVDRDALLRFMQFRTRVFEEGGAARRLDSLSVDERERLLADYIREEALYREARAWGLEDGDYVIRRRLVQSLEYAVGGDVTAAPMPDEAELRRYFDAHVDAYRLPPTVTFTHVFFSFERGGPAAARRRALEAQAALNAGRVDANLQGDRFLYQRNYAEQGRDAVQSHFGPSMTDAVFAMVPGATWQGPVESAYGMHVVQLLRADAGGTPRFEDIRARVAADAAAAAARARQEAALQRIVASYAVERSPDLGEPAR